jgi:hypothetical protein
MTEALALIVAIYALTFLFVICALALGGRADLSAQHELKRLIAGEGEGKRSVHTQFDTQNGERNHD